MEAVKLWEELGCGAISMASQAGEDTSFWVSGFGLVSLVNRVVLEPVVAEEGLYVRRSGDIHGCFVCSVSFLGLGQRL